MKDSLSLELFFLSFLNWWNVRTLSDDFFFLVDVFLLGRGEYTAEV